MDYTREIEKLGSRIIQRTEARFLNILRSEGEDLNMPLIDLTMEGACRRNVEKYEVEWS